MRRAIFLGLFLLAPGWAVGFDVMSIRAQQPSGATGELKDLSVQDLRSRLRLLDREHSQAISEEDYDKAARIVQEINRLDEELLRRHWEAPVPRPPNSPPPRR